MFFEHISKSRHVPIPMIIPEYVTAQFSRFEYIWMTKRLPLIELSAGRPTGNLGCTINIEDSSFVVRMTIVTNKADRESFSSDQQASHKAVHTQEFFTNKVDRQ